MATQLLARLGAAVVKVDILGRGESGRGCTRTCSTPRGGRSAPPSLRNNPNKRSLALDLKHPEGRELFLALVPRFDVVCENFKAGTMDRLGLGYEAVAERYPSAVYLSLSGFGSAVAALPVVARACRHRRGHVRHLRVPRRAGRAPWANPVGASATSAASCSARWACWQPCASVTAPGRASTSTWPCSTR